MSDTEEGRIRSIDELGQRQDAVESKLDKILGIIGGGEKTPGEAPGEASPGGRPGSVREQVRAELERAESERKAREEADRRAAEHETLAQQVAKLTEKKPEPPQPRRQAVMWGRR